MRILGRNFIPGMLSFCAVLFLAGCKKDEVTVYDAPKEVVVMAKASDGGMGTLPDSAKGQPAPVHWTTPQGWQELAPTGIRIGNLVVPGKDGQKAEVTILSFPGAVGTELANVNRWRGELGLPSLSDEKISSSDVNIGPDAGKVYEISSDKNETVAAVLEKDGASWFFKMKGDKLTVEDAKTAFGEFLKSIRFGEAESQATAATEKSGPTWDVPANWHEQEANAMLLKSYAITDDAGHKATATISTLSGDGGGVLQNINRWRGQLGLHELEETDLENMASFIDVMGGKATMMDMIGTNAKTGKPGRIVGAVVPRDDATWFYKLTGDEEIVGKEKPAFIKFVQGVRY